MVNKDRPRLVKLLKGSINLDGQAVSYIVKRSARARHVRLEIRCDTGLVIVIPRRYALSQLPDVLKAKQRWILRNFLRHGEVSLTSSERQLRDGDFASYLGRQFRIVVRGNSGTEGVKLERNRLVVTLPSASAGLYQVLERWYRIQASQLIPEKVLRWGAKLGVNHNKVIIRGQKSRWGSCSHRGTLSFNWKLLMAPEPVVEYVIIHELAHLKQMNHSKRFWKLVSDYCPEWRECKKWLRVHEDELKTGLFARQLALGI